MKFISPKLKKYITDQRDQTKPNQTKTRTNQQQPSSSVRPFCHQQLKNIRKRSILYFIYLFIERHTLSIRYTLRMSVRYERITPIRTHSPM